MSPQLAADEYITTDAEDYFQRLLADIKQASISIECETYILTDDAIAQSIIDALAKACHRGVKVRLLVDGFGASPLIDNLLEQLESEGGEVRLYHPLPWRFWQWHLAINHASLLSKLAFLISRINRRNHRKLFIIDQKIHWLGSFNITQSHFKHKSNKRPWRDTAIRVLSNETVVREAFDRVWLADDTAKIKSQQSSDHLTHKSAFRINDSRLLRRQLYRQLLKSLSLAERRIVVTTPYFVPEPRLLRRLKKAACRGVDVKILLPAESDVFFMPWVSALFYHELLTAGVKIYEYNAGILHAKSLLIDDWGMIGSTNFNSRSIFHDLEIDYVISKKESLDCLQSQFENDIKHANQIEINDFQKRNPILKFLGRLALFLRYWL